MHFKNVVLDAYAYALPEDVWSSERIENTLAPLYKRLKLPQGRLEMMTGIRERRQWSSDFLPSDAAILAGKALLQKSGFSKADIDVLINASVCRNRLEPATAAYIHHGLNLHERTAFFDLSNACLGVLDAIVVGASMIEAETARSILIVSGENGRPLLDHTVKILNNDRTLTRQTVKPYFANLTIGSGAIALLLRRREDVQKPRPLLLGGIACSDAFACKLCEGGTTDEGALSMRTDASTLLGAGIKLSTTAWEAFKKEMSWNEQTPNCILTHQVGLQHQRKLFEALNLDIRKNFSTFETLGNTGSVALPISLCKAAEAEQLQSGGKILLLGIGSGLSTLMLGMVWQG
ncbi:MAG: 3-oxoacyl-ACP synthase III [Opitutales bacterium]|nr:3-oxoacyl-ACP synthase III [Opitutales bacterium]